ncbi:HamA C-terminal domain-containing protein [Stigmatella erecta]|uniref:Anti-bacteriophage protein A/HamA C-terminal domain-containing protein n=1 Tax=Stigmatella erecta TaxID=83460 RepID=A0A1I0K7K4_9BACT|nr:DUF1837 domain-containing protein [Stigmatella erecta]SEU19625.1 protein of unknown function [Stigmatella erecta]
MTIDAPPFLEAIVHRPVAAFDTATGKHTVGLTGLCAGYENSAWRCDQFAEHLIETWLPEFALRYSELQTVGPRTMGRLLRRAAHSIYKTRKFKKRGEFGELLLHAALAQVFETQPAVSKVYYKDGPNETVKGFDAVHVVGAPDGLELWLGEAKFYQDITTAIAHAAKSLANHMKTDYLKDELAFIVNKIDDAWPHATVLKQLLHPNTSLDKVFRSVCLPVLLTYDSETVARHTEHDDAYTAAITAEWERHHGAFADKPLPARVKIHLFLVPLATKKALIKSLDRELRRWQ